jgi:hypothetical protein
MHEGNCIGNEIDEITHLLDKKWQEVLVSFPISLPIKIFECTN